jgi:polysaccharide pyruvyl transferase WcaK-like protein
MAREAGRPRVEARVIPATSTLTDRSDLDMRRLLAGTSIPARLAPRVSSTLQRLGATVVALRASAVLDRFAELTFIVRPPAAHRFDHVVLATAGNGNIGDQALLESYLQGTAGRVAVVVVSGTSHRLPEDMAGRAEFVVIKHLTDLRALLRRGVRRRFAEVIEGAATFTVIGADVMDGGYHRREAVLRSNLLTFASRRGVATRLISFSWNGHPDRHALRALQRAAQATTLYVRDPESFARLQRAGVPKLVRSSDIVFGHHGTSRVPDVDSWLRSRGGVPFMVVNISGLVGLDGAKLEAYVDVVTWLIRCGRAVVLLPHVIRDGDDDLAAARLIKERCPDPAVYLVSDLWRPSDVAWLAGRAEGVMTGRMHLAVLAMKEGTPSAVIGTQGKVEGLMQLVGFPEFLLEAGPTMASDAKRALGLIMDEPSTRTRLAERLPGIVDLARVPLAELAEASRSPS